MGMTCAEDPFNMGIFFDKRRPFIMGTFLEPQHRHRGISYDVVILLPPPLLSGPCTCCGQPLVWGGRGRGLGAWDWEHLAS